LTLLKNIGKNVSLRTTFKLSFFFPLLKEAKSRTAIPIRALYLLKSDFFNFKVTLAFNHTPSTLLMMNEYDENAYG